MKRMIVVTAVAAFLAAGILAADVVHALTDPRVRLEEAG